MKFSGALAAALATVSSIATGIGGLLIVTDPSTLGVSGNTLTIIAGWLALGGSICTIIIIAIRRNAIPGVATGIGLEGK